MLVEQALGGGFFVLAGTMFIVSARYFARRGVRKFDRFVRDPSSPEQFERRVRRDLVFRAAFGSVFVLIGAVVLVAGLLGTEPPTPTISPLAFSVLLACWLVWVICLVGYTVRRFRNGRRMRRGPEEWPTTPR